MKQNSCALVLTAAFGIAFCQLAMAQYKLVAGVAASGGDFCTSASNRIVGTAGQSIIGTLTGTSQSSSVGFWYAQGGLVTNATSDQQQLPAVYQLRQNYPNPFNPSTTITFELPKSSVVRLSVYDILGREVSVLVNERREAGVHEVKLDTRGLSSGIYFYRMQVCSVLRRA
jgi:hypothetical protein